MPTLFVCLCHQPTRAVNHFRLVFCVFLQFIIEHQHAIWAVHAVRVWENTCCASMSRRDWQLRLMNKETPDWRVWKSLTLGQTMSSLRATCSMVTTKMDTSWPQLLDCYLSPCCVWDHAAMQGMHPVFNSLSLWAFCMGSLIYRLILSALSLLTHRSTVLSLSNLTNKYNSLMLAPNMPCMLLV